MVHHSPFGTWSDDGFTSWLEGITEKAVGTAQEEEVKAPFAEIEIMRVWDTLERRKQDEAKGTAEA
jgi:hypothetical protein